MAMEPQKNDAIIKAVEVKESGLRRRITPLQL